MVVMMMVEEWWSGGGWRLLLGEGRGGVLKRQKMVGAIEWLVVVGEREGGTDYGSASDAMDAQIMAAGLDESDVTRRRCEARCSATQLPGRLWWETGRYLYLGGLGVTQAA